MSTAAAREDGGSEVVRLPQRTPFTMVDNPIIRGMTDYVALGLYLDMLSHPSGWRINIRQLAKTHKQGRQVLTDAMNDLIARGLVFRVRLQEASGRWSTRTYVCSSPVTLDELRDVRRQYNHRCVFETSSELAAALTADQHTRGTAATPDHADADGASAQSTARPTPPLVTPSTRFPAPGGPEPGKPTAGVPDSDDLAPQELEEKRKIPLPSPNPVRVDGPGSPTTEEVERREKPQPTEPPQTHHPDLDHVLTALVTAWPNLGRRDLHRLQPLIDEALHALPATQVVEHLATNTGGARHPAALLRARLDNLPPPRRQRRLTEWCGQCTSATYRWIQDVDGHPVRPCPICSPQANRSLGNHHPSERGEA
jgi:hypothetical protein